MKMQTPKQREWYLKNREKCLARAAFSRVLNKEKQAENVKKWVQLNKIRSNQIKREWSKRNKEKDTIIKRKYAKNNPACARLNSANRRARRIQATPKWLTKEQRRQIRDFYRNCPPGYEVDHIVPLRGKNVRGLHVLWNLQYLTKKDNRAKMNKI